MCHRRFAIVLLVIFCFVQKIHAQENLHHVFRHITEEDGLLHNDVYSISQDDKGFIWVATSNGLQRYDGSRFVYYPEIISDPTIGFTFGCDMYTEEKRNLLWIIKNNIVEQMDLSTKKFMTFAPLKLLQDSMFSFDAYESPHLGKWRLGDHGLYRYDSLKQHYVSYLHAIQPPYSHHSGFIASDKNTGLSWAASGPAMYVFNKNDKSVYSTFYNPLNNPVLALPAATDEQEYVRYVMVDSKSNVWVSTWGNSFYKYDFSTKKIHTYLLSTIKSKQEGKSMSETSLLVNCMMEDDHNKIWVGTENAGLLCYNEEKNDFNYDILEENNTGSIQYNYKVFNLFQDREQNIWVGTDAGISLFNPYEKHFKFVRHRNDEPASSIKKSEITSCIQIANGDIYAGTWGGGIAVYDSNFVFKKNIHFNDVPENNFVWSFAQHDEEKLWIGCQHGYIIDYNTRTGVAKNLLPPQTEKSTIRCMTKDIYGNIWLGLHNGKIIKWDFKTDSFIPSGDSTKIHDAVIQIYIDRSQQCWVSTENGFKRFDMQQMKFIKTWLPVENKSGFSGVTSQGIEELDDSTLAIGSVFGGLNFFNKKSEIFSHITVRDGLPSSTVYAIKRDTSGYIWVTADYGLYKFRKGEKKFIPYNLKPGVIKSSFQSPEFYTLRDGRWMTFTTTEIISFDPRFSDDKTTGKDKIEITGFTLFGKPIHVDSLLNNNEPLRLNYKENFFYNRICGAKLFKSLSNQLLLQA